MAGEAELKGPDLAQGVALSDLEEGRPVLGHAEGEAVMLVRRGAEIHAVGAACTHYGGPLAEGLVVDDTVRCPWHHACFSLRTGEALKAPALAPVGCWNVVREGERVRVADRRPAPAPPPSPADAPESIVIIGAGAAGAAAADMLRRQGYPGPITMVGAEQTPPVDRPNLSKDYLAGNAPEEWVFLGDPTGWKEQRIELLTGVRATAIDPDARRVSLSDGRSLSYGALLLATGADPVRLPIPGADLPHVRYLRTLADSKAIIAAAEKGQRAVVIGASFIGLEVAASLRHRGLEVRVVAPESRPLERVMGPEIGDFVRGLHEEHGVQFHLEQTAAAIEAGSVTLKSGEKLPADLVVIGVGVRPAVQLADTSGLALDRGVLVDRFLETSEPGVFAAGDVARYPDPRSGSTVRIEHWVVAERMGQVAARNMLGSREPFTDVPFFWSQHYDVVICYVGHAERWDRIEIDGSIADRDCTLRYWSGGRVAAVLTIFRDLESLRAEVQMEREARR
jgi:NADPH-dependent 2,4-dienoyl-CoA reductase/sulfur reductase-like enzyme/nitrite reductase/ring-hydroxylating ferredoxin subunit